MKFAALFSRTVCIKLVALCVAASAFAALQSKGDIEKRLADPDEKVRRAAVGELAHQNGVAALELVIKSLRDPSAMVADEAQLALASADEEPEFDLLFAKDGVGSKDDMVRLRCAEALGRIDAKLASARLVKLLGDKNPKVRRAMAWSIERLALHLGIVESPAPILRKELETMAERDAQGGVRAASIMALAALAPGMTPAQIATFSADKDFEVRCAALLASSSLEIGAKLELAKQALKDANASVRMQAHALLVKLASRDAAILLADALADEKNTHAAWTIVDFLRGMSGMKAGREARYWQQWAKGLAADWKPGTLGPKSTDVDGKTASLVGLPLLSDKITFLIDLSGSMWEERDGKTRKAGAD